MKKKLFFILLLLTGVQVFAQEPSLKKLKEGDLLFCISGDNAITDVTDGVDNLNISHVAIFHRVGKKKYALEATHKGVVLTDIDSLLKIRDSVVVGRVRKANVRRSVANALAYLGKPYDFYFEPNDSAIYCSELVQISYVDKHGQLVFSPIPMSFHDHSGKVTDYWTAYYQKVGKAVPEGEPGSNPGELSRRKEVRILFRL